MRQLRIVTAVCVFSLSIAQVKAEDQFLVDDGKGFADIIISEAPARSTRLSCKPTSRRSPARGFQIRAEPSADVPVQIYVGGSPHAEKVGVTADRLEDGTYRIVSGKDWLALIGEDSDFQPHDLHARDVANGARIREEFDQLTGGRWAMTIDETDRRRHAETGWWQDDRRGSLNAAHDFPRSLGVRWFMPDELGEVVPGRDSIPLPRVDKIVRPDFAMRHHDCNRWDLISHDRGLIDPDAESADRHQSVRKALRTNTLGVRGEILWHFRLGLNWGGEYLGHGMQAVLAREEMKLEHPDYYAIWDGKRQTDYLGEGAPCLSSETLFAEHVRYVRAVFNLFDEPVGDIGFPDSMGKTGKLCDNSV